MPMTGQAKTGRMPVFRVYTAGRGLAREPLAFPREPKAAKATAARMAAAARPGNPWRCP